MASNRRRFLFLLGISDYVWAIFCAISGVNLGMERPSLCWKSWSEGLPRAFHVSQSFSAAETSVCLPLLSSSFRFRRRMGSNCFFS